MSTADLSSYYLSGLLEDYFALETEVISTISSVAFKAVDKGTKESICLWVPRAELTQGGDSARTFLERIELLHSKAFGAISSWGIDANGGGFIVMPPLDGQPLFRSALDSSEAERRFMQTIQVVARLHETGLVCGDLSSSSFWVDREGFVRLVNFVGIETAPYMPNEEDSQIAEEHFLAPELLTKSLSPAADVFSLGVLGYRLFTGHFPTRNPFITTTASAEDTSIAFSGTFPGWGGECDTCMFRSR